MSGALLDEQSFSLDSMSNSAFYESLAAFSPPASHSQPQLMRHNSFSGLKDTTSGLSHSAPVYHRSHSAISASALQAFNYYSPPGTPKKSGETGLSGLKNMESADDFGSLNGDNVAAALGLDIPTGQSASMSMGVTGGSPGDMRAFSFNGLGSSSIVGSPTLPDSVHALHKFLPSNNEDDETWGTVVDVYACDQFRMFEFKVRRCMRGRSHDWTECPFAHPGEKARRRDPRRFHYSGTACPDFRKGSCRRGDACEFAHGVFECWLHPARYRTQPCKDGRNCRRRVCFFAHTPEQLRLLPAAAQAANAAARTGALGGAQGSALSACLSPNGSLSGSYDGSLVRSGVAYDGAYVFDGNTCPSHCTPGAQGGCGHGDGSFGVGNSSSVGHSTHCCASPQMSSPTSTLVGHSPSPPPLSPPLSPSGSPPMSPQRTHGWSDGQVVQNMSSITNSQVSQSQSNYSQSLQASLSQGAEFSQVQSPMSRGMQNSTAMSVAVAVAAANAAQNSTFGNQTYSSAPAHRRHLDRLNSMPTLSIPPVDHSSHRGIYTTVSSPMSSPSSCSPPSPTMAMNNTSGLSDLIATIQQLGIRSSDLGLRSNSIPFWIQAQTQAAQAAAQANQYSSGPSPLRRCSQSVPVTPTKIRWEERGAPRWEVDENDDGEPTVQRVESGRDLRAKIYGRLGEKSRMDSAEAPDIGWVNELVKDEQVW